MSKRQKLYTTEEALEQIMMMETSDPPNAEGPQVVPQPQLKDVYDYCDEAINLDIPSDVIKVITVKNVQYNDEAALSIFDNSVFALDGIRPGTIIRDESESESDSGSDDGHDAYQPVEESSDDGDSDDERDNFTDNRELQPENEQTKTASDENGSEPESDGEREEEKSKSSRKREGIKIKYHMLQPCTCKQKCSDKIDEEKRKHIFDKFWSMEKRDERIAWIFGMITQEEKSTTSVASSKRSVVRRYHFNVDGNAIPVCALFFRHTLGYKHDSIITHMFKNMSEDDITPLSDARGKHKPKHALTDYTLDLIDYHILSFKPAVSHYRRAHAPLRRYLPPELSVRAMWTFFKEDHPNDKVCETTYGNRIKRMNISFCKLGEEECEVCEAHILHECKAGIKFGKEREEHNPDLINPEQRALCEACDNWIEHIEKATESRKAYRADADKYPVPNEHFVSADMQKVIMLPRMPGCKTAQFTRRITMYHETFAPLVPTDEVKLQWKAEGRRPVKPKKPIGMIWNESIQGRNDEDVASAVKKFLYHQNYEGATEIILWVDNCAGQIKNWTIFEVMVRIVNNHPTLEFITIKYFEKGHTFMSADSFHSSVEKQMRRKKKILDFEDFSKCISASGVAQEMNPEDFYDFKNHLSRPPGQDVNYPLLKDVAVAQFRYGSTKLYWKERHEGGEFKNGDFIRKKYRQSAKDDVGVEKKGGPRGVTTSKLQDILLKLGPVIGSDKIKFWKNLPTNDNSNDLTENYDHLSPADQENNPASAEQNRRRSSR